jgi:hypothetical protein
VDHLLVLAPLRVIMTSWPAQIGKWDFCDGMTYQIVHGDRAACLNVMADVYLLNYEGLLSKEFDPDKKHVHEWLAGKRVWLAADESTKLKNSASRRFKKLKRILHYFTTRIIMTGTPTPKHLEDMFAQCYVTDLGKDLGKYVTHFRQAYMVKHLSGYTAQYPRGYTAQPGAMERVAAKIASTTLQLEYEEALPSQVIPIIVPMPPAAKLLYTELKNELLAEIGETTVMAVNAGVLFNKLRQLAQGAMYTSQDVWVHIHDAKLDALEGILEELNGEPTIVLVQFRHDVERIRARFGADIPYIGSGTSATAGAEACTQFSAGVLPVLLGHPSSIALGVDGLQQSCNNVIWFGLDSSWELTYQANLRVVREGNKADQVFIYQIMVDCPTERAIIRNVNRKEADENEFCRLLREEIANEQV